MDAYKLLISFLNQHSVMCSSQITEHLLSTLTLPSPLSNLFIHLITTCIYHHSCLRAQPSAGHPITWHYSHPNLSFPSVYLINSYATRGFNNRTFPTPFGSTLLNHFDSKTSGWHSPVSAVSFWSTEFPYHAPLRHCAQLSINPWPSLAFFLGTAVILFWEQGSQHHSF